MITTDKEKYLRACGFAITQMMERGSSAVVFGIHSDHPVQVRYKDVLEWINKQLDVIDLNPKSTTREGN